MPILLPLRSLMYAADRGDNDVPVQFLPAQYILIVVEPRGACGENKTE